jgi:hypothetical protein
MAVAARNAGIQVIDGPFTGFKGEALEKYREEAEWANLIFPLSELRQTK